MPAPQPPSPHAGRIYDFCARHALLLGLAVGLLVLAVGVWMSLYALLQWEGSAAQAANGRSERRISALIDESEALLTRLNRDFGTDCDAAALTRLRALLLEYRQMRQIGLLDAQGRLHCATGMGQMAQPYTYAAPSFLGATGTEVRLDFPLLMADGQVRAMLLTKGRFVLAVAPSIGSEITQDGTDLVWLHGAAGPITLLAAPGLEPQQRDWLQSAPVPAQAGSMQVEMTALRVSTVQKMPGQPYLLGSSRNLRDHALANPLIPALLLFSVLMVAASCTLLLRTWLLRFATLDYRVRCLCTEENVICMYQPIMDLASGTVAGCEVLMRLRDGDRILFPDQTIPAILRQGMSWQLDLAVCRKALSELGPALPPAAQLPQFKMALNFFPTSIHCARIEEALRPLQDSLNRPGLRLDVEVTEYSVADEAVGELHQLKQRGYLVSVDDFGTGYSNLGSLKKVMPDFLKIDKSFVFDMESASVRSSLIPEIVAIARAVDAQLIAEGVENAEQARLLLDAGVQYAQGYYFAKPMPLQDFLEYLQKNLEREMHVR